MRSDPAKCLVVLRVEVVAKNPSPSRSGSSANHFPHHLRRNRDPFAQGNAGCRASRTSCWIATPRLRTDERDVRSEPESRSAVRFVLPNPKSKILSNGGTSNRCRGSGDLATGSCRYHPILARTRDAYASDPARGYACRKSFWEWTRKRTCRGIYW